MKHLPVYIITGLSGSGKTTAMQAFEDASFYCVDNMPMELVPRFLELPFKESPDITGIAFVMDMRSRTFATHYTAGISAIEALGISPEIVFLEADVDTLIKRFSQTRRQHPVSGKNSLLESIHSEIDALNLIKSTAHHLIDTSRLSVHQLKTAILDLISRGSDHPARMKINVLSFGYKYGIPMDADLVMDMRFLANPYFEADLKHMDGESSAVKDFVLSNPETRTFLKKFTHMLDYLIPLYQRENKAYFTIAVGCTGGRHRSVVIARCIFEHLNHKAHLPGLIHRDIDRDIREI
jgi:UPF0042 nucleotide-binding protein